MSHEGNWDFPDLNLNFIGVICCLNPTTWAFLLLSSKPLAIHPKKKGKESQGHKVPIKKFSLIDNLEVLVLILLRMFVGVPVGI